MSETTAILHLGKMSLDLDMRRLSGPRGDVHLSDRYFRLAERMLRRPLVIVSQSDLIAALYPEPDEEPENSSKILQQTVGRLRILIDALGCSSVSIQVEIGVGYRMQVRGRE